MHSFIVFPAGGLTSQRRSRPSRESALASRTGSHSSSSGSPFTLPTSAGSLFGLLCEKLTNYFVLIECGPGFSANSPAPPSICFSPSLSFFPLDLLAGFVCRVTLSSLCTNNGGILCAMRSSTNEDKLSGKVDAFPVGTMPQTLSEKPVYSRSDLRLTSALRRRHHIIPTSQRNKPRH